jgi:dipeptidyl aminopeptidase/acylaminoacyl peptidase
MLPRCFAHSSTSTVALRTARSLALATIAIARRVALGALIVTTATSAVAQGPVPAATGQKKVLEIDDYVRWRSIDASELSPDGKWLAYGVRTTNVVAPDAKPVLYLKHLETNEEIAVPDATGAQFSSDSRWVVYQVEVPAGRRPARADGDTTSDTTARARPANGNQPARHTELRELATGRVQSWQDVQSASFSPTATHLLLRRRVVTPAGGAAAAAVGGGAMGGAAAAGSVRASDALLITLGTARTHFLGSVGNAEFNRLGTMLAYTVEAAVKDGNGLFVHELASGRTASLDADARTYNRLTWHDAGNAVAVLKGKDVPRMREKEQVLLVVPNVAAAFAAGPGAVSVTLDSTSSGFPRGSVLSDQAPLSWSDDGRRVFVGLRPQSAGGDSVRRRSTDSVPDVDVWRTQDERIQSLQMIRANAERSFTFRSAFDVTARRFVLLADSTMRELDIAPDGRWAVGRDPRGYVSDYGPGRADLYRVNTTTGERTRMLEGAIVGSHVFGFTPDGRRFLYWKDDMFHEYELDAGTHRALGAGATHFVNTTFDYPGPKPSWGIAGFSKDGRGVIVQDRYDLWFLPYGGGAPRNLTAGTGAREEIQFRVARTVPADPMAVRAERESRWIDLSQPLTLAAYGEWTKRSGFYELSGSKLAPVLFEDAAYNTPVRALKADRWLLARQTFSEFPDLRIADRTLATSRQVTDVNPQHAEYQWGRRVLFDFTLKDGTRSQGILAIPDDYQPGEKRPMLVSFYEKNSQGMHRYPTPNFITGMGAIPASAVSKGYLTMLPDVYFRTGQSHSDMLEAVEAATRKVIEMGYADPARIAVHGHSYGGEGAAFIATQSKLFAAVGMGAGVTDLTSDFTQSWGWSYQVNSGSGQNGFDYYLFGQGRWGFSPWERPEVYRFESALTHAPQVSAPVLIMHGTADPTVSFQEGLNFYQALRFNKKDAILLAYPNEGHGLRGLANRRDLTVRYFQFFDHHLRGAPAPRWMTEGVPFLRKDELKDPRMP